LIDAQEGDELFADVFELRRVIEPAAAALAATRASPDEVEALESAFAEMTETAVAGDDAYIASDLVFHATILDGSHNELLANLGSTLRAVFRASFARTRGTAELTLPLHEAVLAAIREGDYGGAEAAMRELIDWTAASLEERRPPPTGRARGAPSRRSRRGRRGA
jgi:DNA-binding FadR family transcriptional regulator